LGPLFVRRRQVEADHVIGSCGCPVASCRRGHRCAPGYWVGDTSRRSTGATRSGSIREIELDFVLRLVGLAGLQVEQSFEIDLRVVGSAVVEEAAIGSAMDLALHQQAFPGERRSVRRETARDREPQAQGRRGP